MPSRMVWRQQQDDILRYLVEVRQLQQWTQIAKTMTAQFYTRIYSGKQCRQRYINHLSTSLTHQDWTPNQDTLLLELYQQVGNKWATIAQQLPGRSDNCVKNRFYSKLRKVTRRINRSSTDKRRKIRKVFDQSSISKIIAVSEARFIPSLNQNLYWIETAFNIIKRLYNFQMPPNCKSLHLDNVSQTDRVKLIQDIINFEQNYKKPKVQKTKKIAIKCNRQKNSRVDHTNCGLKAENSELEQKIEEQKVFGEIQVNKLQKTQNSFVLPKILSTQEQFILKTFQNNNLTMLKEVVNVQNLVECEKPQYFIDKENQRYSSSLKLLDKKQGDQSFLEIYLPQTFNSFCELDRPFKWQELSGKLLYFQRLQQQEQSLFDHSDSNYNI